MGIGLGSLIKLTRGGLGPDELGEILAAAGMDLTMTPVEANVESFRPLALSASLPSARLIEMKGSMKGGGQIHALLVMSPDHTG
jgi:hypothetical protein